VITRTATTAALCLLLSSSALAGETRTDTVYTSFSSDDMHMLLTQMGVEHERTHDSYGDPLFHCQMGGLNVNIYFYECAAMGVEEGQPKSNAAGCKAVQMHAGFSVGTPPTAARMNEWNKTMRHIRGYLGDGGSIHAESDLDVSGGVSVKSVQGFIETFNRMMPRFAEHIGFSS